MKQSNSCSALFRSTREEEKPRRHSCPSKLLTQSSGNPRFDPLKSIAQMFPTLTPIVVVLPMQLIIYLFGKEPQKSWTSRIAGFIRAPPTVSLEELVTKHGHVTILNPDNASTPTRRRQLTPESVVLQEQHLYTVTATRSHTFLPHWTVKVEQHEGGKGTLEPMTVKEMVELALHLPANQLR